MDPRVAIRRKADGLWLRGTAKGRLSDFRKVGRYARSTAVAIMTIRIDLGHDLVDYDIVPADQIEATPEGWKLK